MSWIWVLLFSYLAGLAMPAGALLAKIEGLGSDWLQKEFRHSVIAFGGGALLSAVALVLVPEGSEILGPVWSPIWMVLGAIALMGLDRYLARKQSASGQLVAMLTDFIPEAIALGAAFAIGGNSGGVIALMIGLQNLPEGFNAYREMRQSTRLSSGKIIAAFNLMALLGPVAALLGYHFLSHHPPSIGAIELFAAGGIMYLIFQDIAPQVKLERHWAPPLGAVFGFILGLIGHLAIH